MSTNRRDFLKLAGAAAAAITSAAAAHAGVPASSVAKFDDEYDVVIIGSGFAGMACALKAGQAGKKVLILEKMPTVGGNSAICGGNVACPVNPVQAAQGIKDSKELFIADCLKDGLGINYPNLLGTIADRCNDTIKMVVDCGCEFVPNKMLFEAGHSVPRSYEIKAGTGSGYIIPMHNELKKLPNVKIMTRAKFDDFILDENGRVVGVTYRKGYRFDSKLQSDDIENKSGRPATVKAKNGVMLAAGGFSRDIFFRQAQDPRVVPTTDSTNQPGATAGVLIKALGIGAQPVQLCWLQFLPYCNPREKGFGVSVNFTNHACMDLGLVVDRKTGKRFMDEHAGRKIKSDALFKVIGTAKTIRSPSATMLSSKRSTRPSSSCRWKWVRLRSSTHLNSWLMPSESPNRLCSMKSLNSTATLKPTTTKTSTASLHSTRVSTFPRLPSTASKSARRSTTPWAA